MDPLEAETMVDSRNVMKNISGGSNSSSGFVELSSTGIQRST